MEKRHNGISFKMLHFPERIGNRVFWSSNITQQKNKLRQITESKLFSACRMARLQKAPSPRVCLNKSRKRNIH
uniref:Uncharacterized protein n=1 Tax=Rhizophora mucronata TaxID=61149 RepID=A0A2P2NG48_RHIMU